MGIQWWAVQWQHGESTQPSHAAEYGYPFAKPDNPDSAGSAFKRVVSQEQELRLYDVESEHMWFRQLTKEFNEGFNEGDAFDKDVRNSNSYIGRIFSNTFKDFQPRISNKVVITVSRAGSLDEEDLQRLFATPNSIPNSQPKTEDPAELPRTRQSSSQRKSSKPTSQVENESFIEHEKQRRNELIRDQSSGPKYPPGGQSSQLMLLPKFCDKKNGN